jgi:hypothetical protein
LGACRRIDLENPILVSRALPKIFSAAPTDDGARLRGAKTFPARIPLEKESRFSNS